MPVNAIIWIVSTTAHAVAGREGLKFVTRPFRFQTAGYDDQGVRSPVVASHAIGYDRSNLFILVVLGQWNLSHEIISMEARTNLTFTEIVETF